MTVLVAATAFLCGCSDSGSEAFTFPSEFRWGAAASAYQTEGNSPLNDWERAIRDDQRYPVNGEATDYYRRFDADHQRAASLGLDSFRISIEWSRIEPRPGVYDEAELAHYRRVLESLRGNGLEPLVTLHHFTNPLWLADEGGWRSDQIEERFAAYAELLASRYGDLVDWWSTLNEPMVYIAGLFGVNSFPGGAFNDVDKLSEAYVGVAFAHAAAVAAIRTADRSDADGDGRATRIFLVQSITPTSPADEALAADRDAAVRYDRFYNLSFLDTWVNGRLDYDFDGNLDSTQPVPEGIYDELAGSADVIGITYYTRTRVQAAPGILPPVDAIPCLASLGCEVDAPVVADNGREVYPPGIREAIESVGAYGLPVLIIENGVADAGGDLRANYVVTHLMQVARAIDDGFDVVGYLHWSLTDNYEWADGYGPRFGLYYVDYATQARTLSTGGQVYADIVRDDSISVDLIERYDLPAINPLP